MHTSTMEEDIINPYCMTVWPQWNTDFGDSILNIKWRFLKFLIVVSDGSTACLQPDKLSPYLPSSVVTLKDYSSSLQFEELSNSPSSVVPLNHHDSSLLQGIASNHPASEVSLYRESSSLVFVSKLQLSYLVAK